MITYHNMKTPRPAARRHDTKNESQTDSEMMLPPLMILSSLLLLPLLTRADSRIVGGTNTDPSEYFVQLFISSPGATASCGGTLIHEDVGESFQKLCS